MIAKENAWCWRFRVVNLETQMIEALRITHIVISVSIHDLNALVIFKPSDGIARATVVSSGSKDKDCVSFYQYSLQCISHRVCLVEVNVRVINFWIREIKYFIFNSLDRFSGWSSGCWLITGNQSKNESEWDECNIHIWKDVS